MRRIAKRGEEKAYRKHHICHWRSNAIKACPSFNSAPQPAQLFGSISFMLVGFCKVSLCCCCAVAFVGLDCCCWTILCFTGPTPPPPPPPPPSTHFSHRISFPVFVTFRKIVWYNGLIKYTMFVHSIGNEKEFKCKLAYWWGKYLPCCQIQRADCTWCMWNTFDGMYCPWSTLLHLQHTVGKRRIWCRTFSDSRPRSSRCHPWRRNRQLPATCYT